MAFDPKDWEDSPSTDTPVSAAALIDTEDRVTDYTDSIAAGGVELGHAEITADATRAATSYADVSGLSTTVTTATRPILVTFSCSNLSNGTASGGAAAAILEDGTVIGFASIFFTGASNGCAVYRQLRRNPSAGSHTYKVQLKTLLAGTATIAADTGSGTKGGPASISVVEV